MQRLEDMLGLGPQSSDWLRQAGIKTPAQLRHAGAVAAYKRVLKLGVRPTLNLLWALHGAIEDIHWSWLDEEVKAHLKKEAGF